MATKFGSIAERLIGAVVEFVPDGSDISDDETPVLTDFETKPAEDAIWLDYNIGRITQAAYDPVTEDRTREAFSATRLRYVRENKSWVVTDAYNVTMIDYAATLFDELMYGLAGPIVADTPQAVFANNIREKRGWVRMTRYTEDKEILCQFEFHGKIMIQENPPDSFEPGSPVWRLEHLGDAASALEQITFNPAA